MAINKSMTYNDFVDMTKHDNIQGHLTHLQWVVLNRLISGKKLSSADRRVLVKAGLVDEKDNLTSFGQMCYNKLAKSKSRAHHTKRKVLGWEKPIEG